MVKKALKKVFWGYKASQEDYVAHLKRIGVSVGNNIEIFNPRETVIETLNPHLLHIGSNVSMTGPITILTHDYSVCVLKKWTGGEILGKQRKTEIGNNVFLGWGCCILPGAVIGDNTIIGAYAVVSGILEGNAVYAGNPARKICSITEYYKKTKDKQIVDACTIYREYKKKYNSIPPKELFHEYFYLFEGGNYDSLPNAFKLKFADHGNLEETIRYFNKHKSLFHSYEEFIDYAEKHLED